MTRTQELIASAQANATETHEAMIDVGAILDLLEAHANELEAMRIRAQNSLSADRTSTWFDGSYTATRNAELKFEETSKAIHALLLTNMRAKD